MRGEGRCRERRRASISGISLVGQERVSCPAVVVLWGGVSEPRRLLPSAGNEVSAQGTSGALAETSAPYRTRNRRRPPMDADRRGR